ncbi:hypothetical protein [Sphaerisporangium sp. NPDC051011]|uniref:hypothetical protein n=1 Tax=Sphaerisporangium sp. NPDC051011 TaxID=3155792 RepID=UPI0033C983A7
MIYLSAILVVLAFGLLVAGVVTGTAVLVMWSIVVSVLSAVFLMIGALLRRHELFPSGGVPAATPSMSPVGAGVAGGMMAHPGAVASPMAPPRGAATPVARPMAAPHLTHPAATHVAHPGSASPSSRTFPATVPAGVPAVAGAGGGLAPDTIVLVVPGRKRFHLPGCRQLAGRETDELTYEEARDEGFSACTTCFPEGVIKPTSASGSAETAAHPALGQAPRTTGPIPRSVPGQSPQPALGQAPPVLPGQTLGTTPERTPHPEVAAGRASSASDSRSTASDSRSSATDSRAADSRTSVTGSRSAAEPRPAGASPSTTGRPASPGASPRADRPSPADAPAEKPRSQDGPAGTDTPRPDDRSAPTDKPRPEDQSAGADRPDTTAKPGSSGYRSDETRPVQPLPASPLRTSTGSGSGSGKDAAASARPGGSATAASKPAEPPLISFKAPEVPEASTPFEAFKRPEPSTSASRPVGESKRSPDSPKPPVRDETPKKPAQDDEDDDPVVVVAASPSGTSRKPGGPAGGGDSGAKSATRPAPGETGESAGKPADAEPATGRSGDGKKSGEPKASGAGASAGEAGGAKASDGGAADKDPAARTGDAEKPDGETSGSPADAVRSRTVKVIPGTRRYHSSACPLVKGFESDALETLSEADAKAKGLTHCSVCQIG